MNVTLDRRLDQLGALVAAMAGGDDECRHFLAVELRTMAAVDDELTSPGLGPFEDAAWTERWVLALVDLYLNALERWTEDGSAPGPWQVVFTAAAGSPPVAPTRGLLLGIHAHLCYDVPQALLETIDDDGFEDPAVRGARRADHEHVDRVLAARLSEEDRLARSAEQLGERALFERVLPPLTETSATRLLHDARESAWRNARALSAARRASPAVCKARLDELGARSAERVSDLLRTGPLQGRRARNGLGVLIEGA